MTVSWRYSFRGSAWRVAPHVATVAWHGRNFGRRVRLFLTTFSEGSRRGVAQGLFETRASVGRQELESAHGGGLGFGGEVAFDRLGKETKVAAEAPAFPADECVRAELEALPPG